MRFLKKKIFRAQQAPRNQDESNSAGIKTEETDNLKLEDITLSPKPLETARRTRADSLKEPRFQIEAVPKENEAAFKNIAINYGKAIACFATSKIAIPYLEERLRKETDTTFEEFITFINNKKAKICGICSFRSILLREEGDDEKTAACKKIFQWICEVFIKYFSVNWIMHGRMAHKLTYLKFRFKMLRRVQNPDNFTYIKERIYKK